MHVHGSMWTGTGIPTKSAEERSCLDHKTSGFKLAVSTTEKIEWGRRTTDSLASPQKTLKCFATKSSGILHRTIGHSDLEEERRAWKTPNPISENPTAFCENEKSRSTKAKYPAGDPSSRISTEKWSPEAWIDRDMYAWNKGWNENPIQECWIFGKANQTEFFFGGGRDRESNGLPWKSNGRLHPPAVPLLPTSYLACFRKFTPQKDR